MGGGGPLLVLTFSCREPAATSLKHEVKPTDTITHSYTCGQEPPSCIQVLSHSQTPIPNTQHWELLHNNILATHPIAAAPAAAAVAAGAATPGCTLLPA